MGSESKLPLMLGTVLYVQFSLPYFTCSLSLDLKGLLVELKGYVKPCFCFKHKNFQRF